MKILKCFQTRIIFIITLIILIYIICNPARHARHYYYVPLKDILSQLVQISNQNLVNPKCSYDDLIYNNRDINFKPSNKYEYITPKKGGEFSPTHCTPLYKVAIIIPYRKREQQLEIFINYIHHFLQNQLLHYRIYVVDQQDNKLFNRAKMFNIGSYNAIKARFPCLILHDVDLIPLTSGNIYACALQPRHMSSSVDTFRFNLLYDGLFGGAISIQSHQFQIANGMSNSFEGWGGEDDDFYLRLSWKNIHPYRFPPELSRYTMLKHPKAEPSENRFKLLEDVHRRQQTDGLNNLFDSCNFTIHEEILYTHIIVT